MRWLAVALLLSLCACATAPKAPARIALPQPPPAGEPDQVIGLTGIQLRTAFGAPAFTRKENGSELWRYDSKSCRAFFFLYPSGNTMSVRHVETVPHAQGVAADPGCINALRVRPASPVS